MSALKNMHFGVCESGRGILNPSVPELGYIWASLSWRQTHFPSGMPRTFFPVGNAGDRVGLLCFLDQASSNSCLWHSLLSSASLLPQWLLSALRRFLQPPAPLWASSQLHVSSSPAPRCTWEDSLDSDGDQRPTPQGLRRTLGICSGTRNMTQEGSSLALQAARHPNSGAS